MDPPNSALFDVYLALVSIGWIDGRLDSGERALILRAAERDGMAKAELSRLEEASHWPVSFEDCVPVLSRSMNHFTYGMGTLIAQIDGVVQTVEEAALDALAQVLGITPKEREQIDSLAGEFLTRGCDPGAFEPDAFRAEIAAAVR